MPNNQPTSINFGLTESQLEEVRRKYALLEPLLGDYLSPSQKRKYRREVCETLRISKRTLRRYIQKLKAKGIRSLARPVRRDSGVYRRFSQKLLDKAIELLKQNPYRSVPHLMDLLKADPEYALEAERIKPATLYHHLKKSGHDFKHKSIEDGNKKVFTLFEANYPNQLWQGDARHGIFLPNPKNPKKGKKTYLFAWIDDFSRKVMYARYYWDEKLPRMEHCFKHAVLSWGLPEKLYCDNGKVYISNKFLLLTSDLGIKKIHHPAYSAWCKGKVENLMKKFKRFQQEAQIAGFKTLEELNTALFAWIDIEYNNKVISTTGETPNARFRNNLKHHLMRRVTDLAEFEMAFLSRKPATVNKYGKIRFNNNEYRVKGLPPHTKIWLLYDPFDLSSIQLFHKDRFYCKLSAAVLRSKTMPNIPEESKKSERTVSKEAVMYFSRIREKHEENKSQLANQISITDLAEKAKEEES